MHGIIKIDGISKKREFIGFVDSQDIELQILLADEYFPNDTIIAIEIPEKNIGEDTVSSKDTDKEESSSDKESSVFLKTEDGDYTTA